MSDKACARTELLIGRAGIVRLASAHVLVAGLGGVGGQVAETLARAGVGSLTLVDGDCVAPPNPIAWPPVAHYRQSYVVARAIRGGLATSG